MTAPRSPKPIPFPRLRRQRGFLLTDDEHRFLCGVIGNFHGGELEDLLNAATATPDGRRLGGTDADLDDLLGAIGVEAHGFLKLEEEDAAQPLASPRPGGTAARLLTIYDKIEKHLS